MQTLLDRRYRILERVGEGGAGVVYRARHEEMDRTVAIKVLHPELFPSPVALARFRREARAAGVLVHPHAVTVFDFGRTDEGEPYLAMEYCDGGALSDRIAAAADTGNTADALSPTATVALLSGIVAAVDSAHRQGIVHRDLKPGNILFAGTVAKVADFGLARMLDSDDPGLTAGHAIGSPFYMSPEQCQGRPAGTASDIYSLGVIAYTLLTGQVPFRRGTAQEVLLAHLTEEPLPPQALAPRLGRALSGAVLRALAKNPDARPATAGEFHAALAAALAETTLESAMPLAISGQGSAGTSRSGMPGHGLAAAGSSSSALRVRRALRDRSTGAPSEPIGRGEELALLQELLQAASSGSGQLVTIAGEPGAGKSTLAHAFLRRARMTVPVARIALGRSPEHFGSAEAYSPFLDALGNLLAGGERTLLLPRLLDLAPTWALHLPGVASEVEAGAGETLAGMRSRDRMPREFAAFVEATTADRPLVLLLEDLQWADPASVDLLVHLTLRLEGLRLLLLGTYRPAEVEAQRHPLRAALAHLGRGSLPWSEISPAPFAAGEVEAFLRRELGAPPPPELVAFALRRTEGNPLFLLNVLNHLLQSGAVTRDGDQVILARSLDSMERIVPEGIVALIRQKVDRLDDSDQRLLSAASVEGLEFTAAVAARLSGRDEMEIEERLRALQATHHLVEPIDEVELAGGHSIQRYRFVHSLYQHAFYDALAPKRRAAAHLAAAEALMAFHASHLESMRVALALHFERGRDFPRAIEQCLAAAELAGSRNPRDARPLLAKALELAGKLSPEEATTRRAELLIRLGRHDAESAEFAGDVELYARAEEAVSEALELEPGSVEARTVLGLIHLERGENERAFLDFARTLERAPAHAGAWDGLSYLFKNTGLWTASLAAQERAAELDDRFAFSIRRLSVLIYQDRLEEARAEATALVERRPKFAHYNYWRGIASWYAGERAEARRWIEQAYALDPADPIAQCCLAFVLAAEGLTSEGARCRELLATAEPGAAADGTFTFWIAKVHALLGNSTIALDWIRKAAALGFWDAPWMRKDAAIASLHPLPEFIALAAEIEARQSSFRAFVAKEAPTALGRLQL
ncbi:MAG: protein kinase [Thermoanaerobaculia bacterium]